MIISNVRQKNLAYTSNNTLKSAWYYNIFTQREEIPSLNHRIVLSTLNRPNIFVSPVKEICSADSFKFFNYVFSLTLNL